MRPHASPASHLTVLAFSIVSAVVKVLDTTTAMVVAGSRPFKARATSTGSTLARNRSVRPLDSLAEFCAVQGPSSQLRKSCRPRRPSVLNRLPVHMGYAWQHQ